jgi:hypothetical protein
MKKLISSFAVVVALSVVARAGCLVFDATNPATLPDNTVVYPQSDAFPNVVPIASCDAAAGLLSPATNYIGVDVSATCHPVAGARANVIVMTNNRLYTDGTICGPLVVTQVEIDQ